MDAARENALKEHANALAYMYQDMADGVAELVFEDVEVFRGGFPDKVERLQALLAKPEFLEDLNERLAGLAEAYAMDKEIISSHGSVYLRYLMFRRRRVIRSRSWMRRN